jgi:hypothetical protein
MSSNIYGVNGKVEPRCLANIDLKIDGQPLKVEALVMDGLHEECLLGMDVVRQHPEFKPLIDAVEKVVPKFDDATKATSREEKEQGSVSVESTISTDTIPPNEPLIDLIVDSLNKNTVPAGIERLIKTNAKYSLNKNWSVDECERVYQAWQSFLEKAKSNYEPFTKFIINQSNLHFEPKSTECIPKMITEPTKPITQTIKIPWSQVKFEIPKKIRRFLKKQAKLDEQKKRMKTPFANLKREKAQAFEQKKLNWINNRLNKEVEAQMTI